MAVVLYVVSDVDDDKERKKAAEQVVVVYLPLLPYAP
jgi:hypothetical protein